MTLDFRQADVFTVRISHNGIQEDRDDSVIRKILANIKLRYTPDALSIDNPLGPIAS